MPRDVVRHMRSTVSLVRGWPGDGLGQVCPDGGDRARPHAWMPSPPQDSQCGTVIDVSIDCAVKLIGTNCIIYPVNSKDLQHIWVRGPACQPSSRGPRTPAAPARHSGRGQPASVCPGQCLGLLGMRPGTSCATSVAATAGLFTSLPLLSVASFVKNTFLRSFLF